MQALRGPQGMGPGLAVARAPGLAPSLLKGGIRDVPFFQGLRPIFTYDRDGRLGRLTLVEHLQGG